MRTKRHRHGYTNVAGFDLPIAKTELVALNSCHAGATVSQTQSTQRNRQSFDHIQSPVLRIQGLTKLISSASEPEVFREHRMRTWSSNVLGSGSTAAINEGTMTSAAPVDALQKEQLDSCSPPLGPWLELSDIHEPNGPSCHTCGKQCFFSAPPPRFDKHGKHIVPFQTVDSSADNWVPDVCHATKSPAPQRCQISGTSLEALPPRIAGDPPESRKSSTSSKSWSSTA